MLRFRALETKDQHRLWDWLHIALWDPPPAPPRPRAVLEHPGVRVYAEDWGRPGDVGIVAMVDGVEAGACWVRVLPPGIGLACIDQRTPQLGIALQPEYQHQGYGRPLLLETLAEARKAGYSRLSLTVHPENPAVRMYERCGFRKLGRRNGYYLMLFDEAA
jgi:ribosomal protein S18 acetylase RimI-like enzyme